VIVGLLARPGSMLRPLGLLALLLGLVVARLLPGRIAPVSVEGARPATAPGADTDTAEPSSRQIATFAVLLMLYSGTEAAIGGWVAEHVRRLGASHWAMSATLFWLAISAGRLSTPFLLARVGERRVLVAGLVVANVGTAGLAAAPTAAVALVAVTTAGLGLSPVFPVTFAALTRDVGPTRPRLVGPLFACTGIGSAVLPWMVGAGSTLAGSLGAGLLVPVLGSLALLVLSLGDPSRE
jgi:fucose permease